MTSNRPNRDVLNQSSRSPWHRLWRGTWMGLGIAAATGVAGAGWRLVDFVEQDLAPTVQADLEKQLNRPLRLGAVKAFSWNGIQFGPSTLPAYRRQVQGKIVRDADHASVASVDITFDPLSVLTHRTLNLNIILNQPQLYLDEAAKGKWLDLNITQPKSKGVIKTKIRSIQIKAGTVQLVPYGIAARQLQQVEAKLNVLENGQRLNIQGVAGLDSGGTVDLKGQWLQASQRLSLQTQSQKVAIAPLLEFLPKLPFTASEGRLDGNVDLTYQPHKPLIVQTNVVINRVNAYIPSEDIQVKADRIKGKLALTIPPKGTVELKGEAYVFQGRGSVPEDLILDTGRSRRQSAFDVNGPIKFLGIKQRFWADLTAKLPNGGDMKVNGVTSFLEQRSNLVIQGQGVSATLFDQAFKLPIQVRAGRVNGNVKLKLNRGDRPDVRGVAQLRQVDAQIMGLPQPFNRVNGTLGLQGLTAKLENISTHYGDIPLWVNGTVDPDRGYNLTAHTEVLETNRALKTLGVKSLPFPITGQARANNITVTGEIDAPVLAGTVVTVGTSIFDKIPIQQASANFNLTLPILKITNIQAQPVISGVITGSAQYNLHPNVPWTASFTAQDVPGNPLATLYGANPGFKLGPLQAQTELMVYHDRYDLTSQVQALQGTFPMTGTINAIPGQIHLKHGVAQLPGGNVRVQGQIIDQTVDLVATLPGIDLTAYSKDLRGKLKGELSIQGPFSGFSSRTAIAQGSVQLTEGISLINDPIDAQIRWNGQAIEIKDAIAPGFLANGTLGASLEGPGSPQLTTLDLAIDQRQYDLAKFPFDLPANSHLKGFADFNGQLCGTVLEPKFVSRLGITDLRVNDLDFESQLRGQFQYAKTSGIDLQVDGQRDRINLALNPALEPKAFVVQHQEATVIGRTIASNRLAVDIQNIPLTLLNWGAVNDLGYGPVNGRASGSLQVSLPTYNLSGPLTLDRPSLGPFYADRFHGAFRMRDGVIAIADSELTRDRNRFLLDAQLIPDTNPKFSGEVQIAQGNVQDAIAVLETLQFLAPTPGKPPQYGKANDVGNLTLGEPDAPILIQLQRLAEIKRLLQARAEAEATLSPIPGLETLDGKFRGNVQFKGTAQTGIDANFLIASDQVNWATFPINHILAKGRLQGDTLNFSNLSLQPGTGQVAFIGSISPQRQAGTLTVSQLPLAELGDHLQLPVPLSGQLNGQATLGGNLGNPLVSGTLRLANATVDQLKLQNAKAEFQFQQARLQLNGQIDLEASDPVLFNGSIPYHFPFMTARAKTNDLALQLQIRNQGLSLMNLFSNQLKWIEGNGDLNIEVGGTLDQPQVNGQLNLDQVTIASNFLPEPMTNIMGRVRFDRERVQVESLSGDFSRGQLQASGELPIFANSSSPADPADVLQVQLNDLALNLKGLYKGNVKGRLNVTDSLLEPKIGGLVTLNQGQVVLSDATALSSNTGQATNLEKSTPIQFNNLLVRLEDKIRIRQPPLLNFVAQGELQVNGSIDAPRPEGVVQFTQGELNLLTSIFQLNAREENFATFNPRNGLDPNLKLSLITGLTEVTNDRQSDLNEFSDPLSSTLGTIDSIRVNASVNGQASEVLNNFEQVVELTSNPSRSRSEILALLSGGLPEALQDGNAELALAKIASSTFLNRVQTVVDDAIGGRTIFRLFPVLIPNDTDGAVLAFGGELGYDITDNLSVSVLQILRGIDEPTRFNVSYDINKNFRTRGNISIDGEAVGVLEYRIRF